MEILHIIELLPKQKQNFVTIIRKLSVCNSVSTPAQKLVKQAPEPGASDTLRLYLIWVEITLNKVLAALANSLWLWHWYYWDQSINPVIQIYLNTSKQS